MRRAKDCFRKMAGTLAASARAGAVQPPAAKTQLENATPDVRRFAILLVPLALLLVTFKTYGIEQPMFFRLASLVFGGFAVSYWLPFRFKETFFIALSLAGAYVLLSPAVATLLIAVGLALFAVIRSGLNFQWKALALLGILAILCYGRATGRYPVPREFWPVFGAIFMFRMIVYLYDVKHSRQPARLNEYLSYFFLLPNYYFLLFPVVDFQTFRTSYFKRDIHLVAQQGIWWILRGTIQLLLYRLVYQAQDLFSPPKTPVPEAVVAKIILCYLLYMRVSGQFHIIAGMLHLFGYDLPETNRRYLLAHSINDFWRRANIYWKDFMVKIVYFPVYFKLRRGGDLRAQLLATLMVFVTTWFLHAYQFFWLQGNMRFALNDTLFWVILATMVLLNVWMDHKRRKRLPQTGWKPRLQTAVKIAATFAFIAVLWSMWSADGLTEWLYFLRSGNV
jgi:alginate O-acetyltransferase complex protein AlgI